MLPPPEMLVPGVAHFDWTTPRLRLSSPEQVKVISEKQSSSGLVLVHRQVVDPPPPIWVSTFENPSAHAQPPRSLKVMSSCGNGTPFSSLKQMQVLGQHRHSVPAGGASNSMMTYPSPDGN